MFKLITVFFFLTMLVWFSGCAETSSSDFDVSTTDTTEESSSTDDSTTTTESESDSTTDSESDSDVNIDIQESTKEFVDSGTLGTIRYDYSTHQN